MKCFFCGENHNTSVCLKKMKKENRKMQDKFIDMQTEIIIRKRLIKENAKRKKEDG